MTKPKRNVHPNNIGRPVGAINRVTREAIENAKKTGEMPLAYMLRVMRDKKALTERRDDMAKAAAPYLHPKLQAIEHSGGMTLTHEQALKQLGDGA